MAACPVSKPVPSETASVAERLSSHFRCRGAFPHSATPRQTDIRELKGQLNCIARPALMTAWMNTRPSV